MNNTTINVTVVDNTNTIIVGALVTISIAGKLFNLTTANTGTATATLNLTNITVATITASASGFTSTKSTNTISPNANNFTIALGIDQTQINKTLTVIDSNNTIISNAKVYINGILSGITNSTGQVQIIASAGNLTLQVIYPNYKTFVLTGNYTSGNFPTKIVILPNNVLGQLIVFQTLSNATIIINNQSINDRIVTDENGFGTSNVTIPPGDYSVSIIKSGYVTKTSSITVQPTINTYSLGSLTPNFNSGPVTTQPGSISSLVTETIFPNSQNTNGNIGSKFGDSLAGAGTSATTAITTTPGATPSTNTTAINTGVLPESEYPSEWIYPNSGDGKYLTGSQARIYIGNLFVDEIDTLYYVYNNNRIPVYGYSSANVDAFGQGRRIVQGQLSINFVSEGYLFTVLSEYNKTSATTSNLTTAQQQQQSAESQLASLYTQKTALLTKQSNGDTSQATANSLTAITNQIISLHSNLGSSSITAVKNLIANSTTAVSKTNAIRRDVPFDVIIKASGGGRTTTRKLSNCLLTSNEQVWDNSDNSMKDVYGFIGVELV